MTPEQQMTLVRAILSRRKVIEYTHLSATLDAFRVHGWIGANNEVSQAGYDELRLKLRRSRRALGKWTKAELLAALEKQWRP